MAFECIAELSVYGSVRVVMSRPPAFFVAGSSSVVAGALIGMAAANLIARNRQVKAESPQWQRKGPSHVFIDDVMVTIDSQEGHQRIPFGTITAYRTSKLGLEFNRLMEPPILLGPSLMASGRPDEQVSQLSGWFAHLSHGKLWHVPTFESARSEQPATALCQMDPRFTFGLPPGWRPAEPEIVGGMSTPPPVVAAAVRPEIDGYGAIMRVDDLSGIPDASPQWVEYAEQTAAWMADAWSGSVSGRIAYLEIGSGGRAAVVPITACPIGYPGLPLGSRLEETHVVITRNGAVFKLQYAVIPFGNAPIPVHQDRTDLMTMLATWEWHS
jgi:hypothetical protein